MYMKRDGRSPYQMEVVRKADLVEDMQCKMLTAALLSIVPLLCKKLALLVERKGADMA